MKNTFANYGKFVLRWSLETKLSTLVHNTAVHLNLLDSSKFTRGSRAAYHCPSQKKPNESRARRLVNRKWKENKYIFTPHDLKMQNFVHAAQ